jgi:hypothetical protein
MRYYWVSFISSNGKYRLQTVCATHPFMFQKSLNENNIATAANASRIGFVIKIAVFYYLERWEELTQQEFNLHKEIQQYLTEELTMYE